MRVESEGLQPRSEYWKLARQIIAAASEGKPIREYLADVGRTLLRFSGVTRVEIWLKSTPAHLRCVIGAPLDPSESPTETWLPWPGEPRTLSEEACLWLLCGRQATAGEQAAAGGSRQLREADLEGVGDGSDAGGKEQGSPVVLIPFPADPAAPEADRGVLAVRRADRRPFPEDEVGLLEEMAASLALGIANRRAHASLRERVKELTCLYRIALLVEQPRASVDDVIQGVVETLSAALLYPGQAWVRASVDEREYQTGSVEESLPFLESEILVGGVRRGTLRAGYSVPKLTLYDGPFLREERSLLETVSREVALVVERRDIEARTRDLQEQLIHAERLATIGELSSGVAHELNEPLNNILGFAQLAQKCTGLPEQASQDLERIVSSALHTRQVIQQLLLFARRMPQRRTRLDLNGLLHDVAGFLKTLCAKSRIELVLEPATQPAVVSADPDQTRQVLVNLVVNSAQAMPRGGSLKVRTAIDATAVSLVVEDSGTGIAKENLDRIFMPFFTTREGGTGLGLAVVHGIVASHGGSIRVESAKGKGSRFEVRLPPAEGSGGE